MCSPQGTLNNPRHASSCVMERHMIAACSKAAASRPGSNPPFRALLPAIAARRTHTPISQHKPTARSCPPSMHTPSRIPAAGNTPPSSAKTQKNRRALPHIRMCAAVRHIAYALASVSMACAKILTLSMNFSQSIYSSGIWQVSVSPGKLMPKATVLGIMRE